MKKKITCFFVLLLSGAVSIGQTKHPGLSIRHLTGNVYVYTSWFVLTSGPYPANSAYLVTPAGVVLFDTPWDSTEFQPLLDSIRQRHGKEVIFCLSTHFHADRTAGLACYRSKGIPTWASYRTDSLSIVHGNKRAEHLFLPDTSFVIGGYRFDVVFPGEGHTKDNLVIWLAKDRILYGGCFVKSIEADDIGYTGDANLDAWPAAIRYLQKRFPHPAFVIPGHLAPGGDPLQHSLDLLQQTPK